MWTSLENLGTPMARLGELYFGVGRAIAKWGRATKCIVFA